MSRVDDHQKVIDDLKTRFESLSPIAVRFIARLIDSLSTPPRADIAILGLRAKSEWVEYFGLTISVHHSTTAEPLGLVGFEIAFYAVCIGENAARVPPVSGGCGLDRHVA